MQISSSHILVQELLEGIREGDTAAFEVFYRMERNNLVHFAYSYLRDYQKSEDVAQDALLRIWERRAEIDPGKNLRALVFTIARNMMIDCLRRSQKTESVEACICLEDKSVDGLVEALDLEELFTKSFASLPPKLRNTFMKSRVDGLTNKEIAGKENVSLKTVEYRIGAVLRFFRKISESV